MCVHVVTQLLAELRYFFFSSRRRHTRYIGDWSSDVCSSDLLPPARLWAAIDHALPANDNAAARRRLRFWRSAAIGASEIGRASCRERVWRRGGAGSVKNKTGGSCAAALVQRCVKHYHGSRTY